MLSAVVVRDRGQDWSNYLGNTIKAQPAVVHSSGPELSIRTQSKALEGVHLPEVAAHRAKPLQRVWSLVLGRSRKRLIRYSILAANVLVLALVVGFVLKSSNNNQAVAQNSVFTSNGTAAVNPLDQLSSADIAVNVARMTHLDEAVATVNNADSLDSQLALSSANSTVIDKPQIVATPLRSNQDIVAYVAQTGDTVTSIAAKFNVTSDTIRWSNGLTHDTVAASSTIYVLPGVNGIVYTVKPGDTPDTLATKYGSNKDKLIAYNDAEIHGLQVGERIIIPDGTIAAPVQTATVASSSGFAWGASAIYGYNGYDYGFCTWYVANRRAAAGNPVPSNLGNAYSWYRIATAAGIPTGLTPQVGAVAVNEGGNHVSYVEVVNADGSFWVSEMNSHGQVSMTDSSGAGGWGRVDWKLEPAGGFLKFVY